MQAKLKIMQNMEQSKWPALILMLVGVCFMVYGIFRGRSGSGVYKSH